MRRRYVVGYDIADPKRLRRMHKTMRGYGDALQYSVFLCDLTATERVLMLENMTRIMHQAEDRVFIVDLGAARGSHSIEFLGKQPESLREDGALII